MIAIHFFYCFSKKRSNSDHFGWVHKEGNFKTVSGEFNIYAIKCNGHHFVQSDGVNENSVQP